MTSQAVHSILSCSLEQAPLPSTVCAPVPGYLQCADAAAISLVQTSNVQIQTLSYSQAVIPLSAEQAVPAGCAVAIASDRCTVNLMIKVTHR